MQSAVTALESVLRRDRLVVLAALIALVALAWIYLAQLSSDMPGMAATAAGADNMPSMGMGDMKMDAMPAAGGAMPSMLPHPWDAGYFLAMFLMWAAMMAGMMVPSAAPAILLFAALQRSGEPDSGIYRRTALFTGGYLAAWTAFSLVATAAEWGLNDAALLSPMLASTTPILGGLLFIAAGVYQITPLKNACLRQCRTPAQFLVQRRRTGPFGPFVMGIEHGAYCVGCCWVLMALLFAVGVMNLLWVAAIAAFVLSEKLLPAGPLIARIGAALMVGAGVTLLVAR